MDVKIPSGKSEGIFIFQAKTGISSALNGLFSITHRNIA